MQDILIGFSDVPFEIFLRLPKFTNDVAMTDWHATKSTMRNYPLEEWDNTLNEHWIVEKYVYIGIIEYQMLLNV